jgi:TPR repeat protein
MGLLVKRRMRKRHLNGCKYNLRTMNIVALLCLISSLFFFSTVREKAAELGSPEGLANLGTTYLAKGERTKAKYYLEKAAIKGSIEARHHLGHYENETLSGKERMLKHFTIAARVGYRPSMECLKKVLSGGLMTREEYKEVLREYLVNVQEMTSELRLKTQAYCSPIDDATLFCEQFPPKQKCPKCNLALPPGQGSTYNTCCGTTVCGGCNNIKAFHCISCGRLAHRDENEVIKRVKQRMKLGDPTAYNVMGLCHQNGMGVKQDYEKAIELFTKAGELGHAAAFGNIASLHDDGRGVSLNILKAKYYYGKAAIMGDHSSRHNLGCIEGKDGNLEKAMKHFRIAAKNGVKESLEILREKVAGGMMEQSDFDSILQDYERSINEIKSEQRDLAAALLEKGMGVNMPMDSKNTTNDAFNQRSMTKTKPSKVAESWNAMKRK